MNELEALIASLQGLYTFDLIVIDPPNASSTTGGWWAILYYGQHCVEMEWRPQQGFGASVSHLSSIEGMFEGHDEVFSSREETYQYIDGRLNAAAPVCYATLPAQAGAVVVINVAGAPTR